jgi:hypothetical protein
MVKLRKKRVAMTKQLKEKVFMACLMRVSHGFLPIGSFKAIADEFNINPKTVAKLWYSTMKQVTGYQVNAPIYPPSIVSNLPSTAFNTKFENAGRKPQFDHETVARDQKN